MDIPGDSTLLKSTGKRTRRRRRALIRAGLIVMPLLTITLVALLAWRPATYQPASVDLDRLPVDKRDLVNLVDRISANLNDDRPVDVELDENQVNRWIAARDHLWVDDTFELPPEIADPQIRFVGQDRVELAARMSMGPIKPVVTLTLQAQIAEDGIVLRCESLRIGSLPVPQSVLAMLGKSETGKIQGRATVTDNEIRMRSEFVWRNGNRRFRLSELHVSAGRAHAVLQPVTRKK